MLNIKHFIFVFLITAPGLMVYGSDSSASGLIGAIQAGKDFAHLTPVQECAYLPQVNNKGEARSFFYSPLEFAAFCGNSSALSWLASNGCNIKENRSVLGIAIDRYQSLSY